MKITRSRKKQLIMDTELKAQVKDVLKKEGLFLVKLFNLGE